MTGFDILALIILVGSLFAGWFRGAVREVVSLISFAVALVIALLALPVTGPIGRGLIDPDWIGVVLAGVVSFALLYFGIRLLGSTLSKSAKDGSGFLSGLDRVLGLIIGFVRGLLLLGALHLVVMAALPGERTPDWLSQAKVRPVSAAAARVIQIVLPGIASGADSLTSVVQDSVRRGFNDEDALLPAQSGTTSPLAEP